MICLSTNAILAHLLHSLLQPSEMPELECHVGVSNLVDERTMLMKLMKLLIALLALLLCVATTVCPLALT